MLFSNIGKKNAPTGGLLNKKTGKVETIPGVTFVKPKYVFSVAACSIIQNPSLETKISAYSFADFSFSTKCMNPSIDNRNRI